MGSQVPWSLMQIWLIMSPQKATSHPGRSGSHWLPFELQGFAYDPAAIPVFTEKNILIPWEMAQVSDEQQVLIWKIIWFYGWYAPGPSDHKWLAAFSLAIERRSQTGQEDESFWPDQQHAVALRNTILQFAGPQKIRPETFGQTLAAMFRRQAETEIYHQSCGGQSFNLRSSEHFQIMEFLTEHDENYT